MPSSRSRAFWDAEAGSFDDEPDHGLSDPTTRAAWRDRLASVLPAAPVRIADLGCGTGTLSRLLVDEGHTLVGLDFSPSMIERAERKVPEADFVVGDAADPPLDPGSFDVVLCRHVLWALPDPVAAFGRWADLLAPGGVVILVEGRWHTGGSLSANDVMQIVRSARSNVEITHLTESVYWGKEIDDERFLVVSRA